MKLSNWGNWPKIESRVEAPVSADELEATVANTSHCITRGNGRCYGDAALHQSVVSTLKLQGIEEFDAENGTLCCAAGTMLSSILNEIVPQGWFLPVTPGTKFITVGGAIAADIHGKNHHVDGSFGQHVHWFDLLLADGSIQRCSKNENSELFRLTVGGMGLTGTIVRAAFELRKISTSYIAQRNIAATNLDALFGLFEQHADATYSVAWLDTFGSGPNLGRSVLMLGEHATKAQLNVNQEEQRHRVFNRSLMTIPRWFPSFALNSLSIRIFNWWYGKRQSGKGSFVTDYDTYFYPLDKLKNWNRIYGSRGFLQYQFVVPKESGKAAITAVLKAMQAAGIHSFLSVLKQFGPENPDAVMSFPMEGYTLTLDFPVRPTVLDLCSRLDEIVVQHGGRLYLAKDSRMSRTVFEATWPQLDAFKSQLATIDPESKFTSVQADRLGIKQPS